VVGPSVTVMLQVCGPPPMMAAISGDKAPDKSQGEVSGLLASMGYTKDHVYKF
jgi:cytochrome-b5 reductase